MNPVNQPPYNPYDVELYTLQKSPYWEIQTRIEVKKPFEVDTKGSKKLEKNKEKKKEDSPYAPQKPKKPRRYTLE